MSDNVILTKTYSFAVKIVKLSKFLNKDKKEYTLSNQILRSGTSIGANAEEASGSISKKDFRAKYFISYKEARETRYWLRLLRDSDYIDTKTANDLIDDVDEILRILGAILKTVSKKE